MLKKKQDAARTEAGNTQLGHKALNVNDMMFVLVLHGLKKNADKNRCFWLNGCSAAFFCL